MSKDKTLVPVPPLVTVYKFFRDCSTTGMMREFAHSLKESKTVRDNLVSYFEQSVDWLKEYCNDEPIVGSKRSDVLGYKDKAGFAQRLVGHVAEAGTLKVEDPGNPASNTELLFCGYEVQPMRTTGGVYETGKSARDSGGGGIDLLLRSGDEDAGSLVVGELKASTDRGVTYALIQGLAYAATIFPLTQRNRSSGIVSDDIQPFEKESPLTLLIIGETVKDRSEKARKLYEAEINDLFSGLDSLFNGNKKIASYIGGVIYAEGSNDKLSPPSVTVIRSV